MPDPNAIVAIIARINPPADRVSAAELLRQNPGGIEIEQDHLKAKRDRKGKQLLSRLVKEVPVKENPAGIPSLWYMPLVGGERFFDGFGFAPYRKRFGWKRIPLDRHEESSEIKRPPLPYLESVSRRLPKKWDNRLKRWVQDDDWLFWELGRPKSPK